MPRPIRPPELAELETLVVCAAEGSLAGAAERLGISRPAVAKRMRNLEALAGRPLLDRGARGVRLTGDGATLLAGARRVLDERDTLMGTLTALRAGGGSADLEGVRELLGRSTPADRAAQRPEARLAETERLLAIVLGATATGVVISDPDTALVREVNDAFCRFLGRERDELVGRVATESGTWYDDEDRGRLVAEVRRTGGAHDVTVRALRPDGSLRVGTASSRVVQLAGRPLMLTTVDDVTHAWRLGALHAATVRASHGLAGVAARAVGGNRGEVLLAALLAELRDAGGFRSALLWTAAAARPALVVGEPVPAGLGGELARARPVRARDGVDRVGALRPAPGALTGLAGPATGSGDRLVVLAAGRLDDAHEQLFAGVLEDATTLVVAAG